MTLQHNKKSKIPKAVDLLKEGIRLVTEFGSYANRDGLSRLAIVERDFTDVNAEIIRRVGKQLLEVVIEKEDTIDAYKPVTQMMYNWACWKRGKK